MAVRHPWPLRMWGDHWEKREENSEVAMRHRKVAGARGRAVGHRAAAPFGLHGQDDGASHDGASRWSYVPRFNARMALNRRNEKMGPLTTKLSWS